MLLIIDNILSNMKECKNCLSNTSQEENKHLKISDIIHLSHQCHFYSISIHHMFVQTALYDRTYMVLYLLISVEKQ